MFDPGWKLFLSSRFGCLAEFSISLSAVDKYSPFFELPNDARVVLSLRAAKER